MAGRLAGELAAAPYRDARRRTSGHLTRNEGGELAERSLLRRGGQAEQGGSAIGEIRSWQRATSCQQSSSAVRTAACLRVSEQASVHGLVQGQLVR